MHLVKLGGSNGIKTIAMDGIITVFDFGEVDFAFMGGDNVDFVEFGFVVASDDVVALGF